MNTDSKIIIKRSKDINVFSKHLLSVSDRRGEATSNISAYADTAFGSKCTRLFIRSNSFSSLENWSQIVKKVKEY